MATDWTAAIAGERMELDGEFGDRVDASSLTRQQWGLAMTAIELEIENPSDPDAARLRPDTSNLPAILPELDAVGRAGPAGVSGGAERDRGGFLASVKDALGLGGVDDERREEIERLAEQYCERLEEMLRSRGRWEGICHKASGGGLPGSDAAVDAGTADDAAVPDGAEDTGGGTAPDAAGEDPSDGDSAGGPADST